MPAQSQLIDTLSAEHLQSDLKGRSVRGVAVTLSSQGALALIQWISTMVLARLLIPTDFGLVAMVTAVSELATPFSDLGLSQATIQRKEISQVQVSALFWINTAVGLALTLIMAAAFGPMLAFFYREPRLKAITAVLSLTFLICGVRAQPEALLRRQLRFSALAKRNIAAMALSVAIGITMAWRGAGYWAVVAVPLIGQFIQMALTWFMVKWRPGPPRRDARVGSMLAFGSNVTAGALLFQVHRNADNILIGWYWGAGPLGVYSRAYNLIMQPVRQINVPVANVAIPTFSRLHDNPERFARYYLRAISLMVWIAAPLFGFLFVAAEPTITLMLGHRWRAAAPVFQIYAVCALGQLLLQTTVWMLISRGQSQRLLKMLLMICPVVIGSFVVGLPFGIKGVARSYCLALLAVLPLVFKFAFRGTNLTLQRLGRAMIVPVSLCLFGVFLAELALHVLAPGGTVSKLLVAAAGFVVAYSLAALIPRVREELLSFRKLMSELRPATQTVGVAL